MSIDKFKAGESKTEKSEPGTSKPTKTKTKTKGTRRSAPEIARIKTQHGRMFFSRSGGEKQRHLSNFTQTPNPMSINSKVCEEFGLNEGEGEKKFTFEGTFYSVEAVYQASKYVVCTGNPITKKKMFEKIMLTFDAKNKLGAAVAKSLGSQSEMDKNSCVLNPNEWTLALQVKIMTMAVSQRAKVDAVYALELEYARKNGFIWLHYDKKRGSNPPASFWVA